MRIKKVKLTSNKKITVVYEQQSKKGTWDEYSLTCSDEARPEFYAALLKMRRRVWNQMPDAAIGAWFAA